MRMRSLVVLGLASAMLGCGSGQAIPVKVEELAKELSKAHEEGTLLAFDMRYKGKVLRITGKMGKSGRVADTMMATGRGDYYAVFDIDGSPRCEFAKPDALVNVKKGDNITIEGRLYSTEGLLGFPALRLEDCRVVNEL